MLETLYQAKELQATPYSESIPFSFTLKKNISF